MSTPRPKGFETYVFFPVAKLSEFQTQLNEVTSSLAGREEPGGNLDTIPDNASSGQAEPGGNLDTIPDNASSSGQAAGQAEKEEV